MRQQGRTPGLEQMLKRLGYEQQLIREAAERLGEMMEKFSQALGDLQAGRGGDEKGRNGT